MGPMYNDRERPRGLLGKEPLVDIDVKPPLPHEPQSGFKPRRKRLSDIETEASEPQPQPPARPSGRRSLAADEAGAHDPPFEAPSRLDPQRPRRAEVVVIPEEPEAGLKPGRSRGAITHPCDDVPGLQNIVDPPRSVHDMPASASSNEAVPTQPPVDPAKVEQLVGELRAKQNFPVALVGGLAAAVVGAMVWALITVATNYQIGWMAVGVGFLVGGTVRTLGRGIDKSFGYLGAALSVFGCLLGNLLSLCAVIAGQESLSPLTVLAHICGNPVVIPAAMIATFHPMDLLFYGIAVYEGYRFSFRQITDADIGRVTRDD